MMNYPTEEEFRAATNAPDLHAMIVRAQAEVEATLRIALAEALLEPHQLELEKLSFPLKVDLSIALRAIRPGLRALLLKLNNIRNEFAHNARTEFLDQAAKDLVNIIPQEHRMGLSHRFTPDLTPREVLRISFVVAYFEARQAVDQLRSQKARKQEWLVAVDERFKKYDPAEEKA